MKRIDILSALLIQVIEKHDQEGRLISYQERREADRFLEGDRAGKPSDAIAKRAQILMSKLQEKSPVLFGLSRGLTTLNHRFIWGVIGLGLLLGFTVHSLGEGRYFHLLSPVLLGIMLWNAVSMSALLWSTINSSHNRTLSQKKAEQADRSDHGTEHKTPAHVNSNKFQLPMLFKLLEWFQVKWFSFVFKSDAQAQLKQKIMSTYFQRLMVLNREQIVAELRRCLHVMSISFIVGVSLSAYWDGLIHEYQASAESTFLGRSQIESVLNFLLYPSIYFGLGPISLEQFSDQNVQKLLLGPAAIWVHRYVLSLLVWIVIPRIMFIFLESIKVWRSSQAIPLKLSWLEPVATLNIALASHTNIGKTSLARTLLKRDVGEVKNEKHVTRSRSSYFLLKSDRLRVRLWDTPGFGDLRSNQELRSKNDRFEYALEQEAIQTLKEEADVIFYLVPARPSDKQKQQVKNEIQIISCSNIPIVIMINRLYDGLNLEPNTLENSLLHLKQEVRLFWERFFQEEALSKQIKSVLILDAFERSYQDEQAIFQTLSNLDLKDKMHLSASALQLWEHNLDHLFEALASSLSQSVQKLLKLSVVVSSNSKKDRKLGQEILTKSSEQLVKAVLDEVLDHIGLEGQLREEIFKESLESSVQQPGRNERRKWGAIIGGAISGLGTGVAADIMSGGLSLGGGMIVGAVLGAIGGMGVVEGYDYINEAERELGLSLAAVYLIHEKVMLFTISASTHGRAQGIYQQQPLTESNLQQVGSSNNSLLSLSKKLSKQRHLEIHQLIGQKYKDRQFHLLESLRKQQSNPHVQQELLEFYKELLKESLMSI